MTNKKLQKIISLAEEGYTVKEVAKKLNIKMSTLHYYRYSKEGIKFQRDKLLNHLLRKIKHEGLVFTSYKETRKLYSLSITRALHKIFNFPDAPEYQLTMYDKTGNELYNRKKINRLYNRYCDIKYRCYNKDSKLYKYYGGRGIKVCTEWLVGNDNMDGFDCFATWSISNGYIDNMRNMCQIDRINNYEDYTPENCRWTTPVVNMNNRKNSIVILHEGKHYSVYEYAKLVKKSVHTIRMNLRMNRYQATVLGELQKKIK